MSNPRPTDGVSSALFSGPWATILAEAVVADPPDPTDAEAFACWLQERRKLWAASIDTTGLAWFQRAKLPAGAFSTLLWIGVLQQEEAQTGAFGGCRLVGHAIGDSCLFHVRGDLHHVREHEVRRFVPHPLQRANLRDRRRPRVVGCLRLVASVDR